MFDLENVLSLTSECVGKDKLRWLSKHQPVVFGASSESFWLAFGIVLKKRHLQASSVKGWLLCLCHSRFVAENSVDQILGTPNAQQLKQMNPFYDSGGVGPAGRELKIAMDGIHVEFIVESSATKLNMLHESRWLNFETWNLKPPFKGDKHLSGLGLWYLQMFNGRSIFLDQDLSNNNIF